MRASIGLEVDVPSLTVYDLSMDDLVWYGAWIVAGLFMVVSLCAWVAMVVSWISLPEEVKPKRKVFFFLVPLSEWVSDTLAEEGKKHRNRFYLSWWIMVASGLAAVLIVLGAAILTGRVS